MSSSLDGIMLIDKEVGITSYDVIRRIKQVLKQLEIKTKIGHAGTLDPFASGLLVVLFGKCTRLSDYLMGSVKSYSGIFKQGKKTITGDLHGEIIDSKDFISSNLILDSTSDFIGKMKQIPPYYSALKHNGKKLYEYARNGIYIEKPARYVDIYNFTIDDKKNGFYSFSTKVSKGTYVRKLLEDYIESLGGLCYLTELRRDSMEPYVVEDAISSSDLDASNFFDALLKIDDISLPFDEISIKDDESIKLRHGIKINTQHPPVDTIIIKDSEGTLAIGAIDKGKIYTKFFLRDI